MLKSLSRFGFIVFVMALSAYSAILAFLYISQRSLIYQPNPTRVLPSELPAHHEVPNEIELSTPDGHTVIAWWYAPTDNKPTLILFHGNAGGLLDHAAKYDVFARAGYGVLAMSYRGYSGSSGGPSEEAFIADAELGYDWLMTQGVTPDQLFIYGYSLGSGVAVQLAARRKEAGVILEAPYLSMLALGQKRFSFFPVHLILKDQFRSDQYIPEINAPLLVLHGTADRDILYSYGAALFALAEEPKQFVTLEGVDHYGVYANGLLPRVIEFLSGSTKKKSAS